MPKLSASESSPAPVRTPALWARDKGTSAPLLAAARVRARWTEKSEVTEEAFDQALADVGSLSIGGTKPSAK